MPDDEHPDARDPEVATALEVEPLDELTRRRLVTTALRETEEPAHRPSRAWRWVAAAAAVVVIAVGTLAIVTAKGGHDEQRATAPVRTPAAEGSAAPKAVAGAAPNVGDFGNLDDPANLTRLRSALSSAAGSSFASDSTHAQSSAGAQAAAPSSVPSCTVGDLPGDTRVAQGTGTLDGRAAIVVLVVHADGSRSVDAVLSDPCEVRSLGTG